MKSLRRPEVIVFLLLVLAGLGWVALQQRPSSSKPSALEKQGAQELAITGVTSTPEGAHQRVRITFTLRHSLPSALAVRPSSVKLRGPDGAELPHFFAPGEFPPDLPPGTTAASWAEFWLTPAQAQSPLTLEVAGTRATVPAF